MLEQIREFVLPYYKDKDIMHDISHLDRVRVVLDELKGRTNLEFNPLIAEAALYFHGIVYSNEIEIRNYLNKIGVSEEDINLIIKVAWESQKESRPKTNEGLMLHDAHMLEGGKNFEIIKSFITGSIRGQSLEETMVYIEKNTLEKGSCYTEEGKKRYFEMKRTTMKLFMELNEGLGREKDKVD